MTFTDIMPFAGSPLDFCETKRSPEELQHYMALPAARAILFHKGKPAVGQDGKAIRVHPSELIGQNLLDPHIIFMGLDGNRPIFAANLAKDDAITLESDFQSIREIGGRLDSETLALFGRAKSIFDWHKDHMCCAKCGAQCSPADGGHKRVCPRPECQAEHFPRVNPVVIMLVVKDDKVLLGRGPGWPEGFMSTLAGFVSPGETIEEATAREVLEEAGIRTKNHRYIASQPWPFPSQLMIGVICEAENTDIQVNPDELEDAQWFSRDEVAAVFAKTGNAFRRPPRIAIAHQLLKHWLQEGL
ncbi:NAD+ diphosphatase [Litorimonas taeanensis]|uniref:NAD(+) diphosphatase n=1 Tax=Litorimonas taeanensis TaxID=568099 RepID=A0A420WDV5_9PROT|nr:NAD(+) diphosphatase [Litorimonas taeanensis]RKQ69072.1 NAD+ diphosphatase [Litorimonas taeanensis]